MSAVVDQWYYMRGGERVGPVTQGELCALFEGRALALETLVWGEAFGSWVPASTIAGFRALLGVEAGTGGVLGVEGEGREPLEISGWLIVQAICRVIVPATYLLATAFYLLAGWVGWQRGMVREASLVQVGGVIVGLIGVYELWASALFFRRKRAAVPVLIVGWVVWAFCGILGVSLDEGRRPRGISQETWWLCGVGWVVLWAGGWVLYFSVSERVKRTFVR